MTERVYLRSVQLLAGPAQPGVIPAERLFVHACECPEVWVETDSFGVPEVGRAVSFAFRRPLSLGIDRIAGTVERKVLKGTQPVSPTLMSPSLEATI